MLTGLSISVLGGAGFLGRHLLPLLLAAGARVSCLARPSRKPRQVPPGARLLFADCESGQGLEAAFAGQDIVIHMAGLLFGASWRDYFRANVGSAENIVRAMKRTGAPEKLIFISSLAAAGPCAKIPGKSEADAPAPVSAYGWSKLAAEYRLKAALKERLVILRPPIIYGSGDRGLLPLFKSAARGLAISPGLGRRFPVSAIHADDAARAIILACRKDAAGAYHLCDGQIYDMAGFCRAMGRAMGREKLFVARMPLPLMAASAAAGTGLAMLAKMAGLRKLASPHWNFDKYRESREAGWLADSSLIRESLGFEPKMDIDSGMAEAVAGYRALGWL